MGLPAGSGGTDVPASGAVVVAAPFVADAWLPPQALAWALASALGMPSGDAEGVELEPRPPWTAPSRCRWRCGALPPLRMASSRSLRCPPSRPGSHPRSPGRALERPGLAAPRPRPRPRRCRAPARPGIPRRCSRAPPGSLCRVLTPRAPISTPPGATARALEPAPPGSGPSRAASRSGGRQTHSP